MRNYPMQGMTEESARNCDSYEKPCRSCREMMAGHGCRRKSDCKTEQQVTMAYVPWQQFCSIYEPEKALLTGTIFPELDKPFLARGGRR